MTGLEQHVLLARGEQVTLQMDLDVKKSQFKGEVAGFVDLLNRLTPTGDRDWLHVEIARLKRVDALQGEIAEISARISELKCISGI